MDRLQIRFMRMVLILLNSIFMGYDRLSQSEIRDLEQLDVDLLKLLQGEEIEGNYECDDN